MANYFYVKAGGTAAGASVDAGDGVYSSKLTGTWSATASEYYPNLYAVTNGTVKPTSGDYVLVSDVHSSSYAPGGSIVFTATDGVQGIQIISVDDTDRAAYKPGALEVSTNTYNIVTNKNVSFFGVSYTSAAAVAISPGVNSNLLLQDMTLTVGTAFGNDWLRLSDDGVHVTLINVNLYGQHNSSAIYIRGGSMLEWYGGAVIGTATHTEFIDTAGNGGTFVFIKGVDLSRVTGIASPTETDDNVIISLNSCKLNASFTIPTPYDDGQVFEMYNCDDATGNDFHRFLKTTGCGSVYNSDSVYVTATEAWYGGSTKSSMEVTTTAFCNHGNPFVFELPAQYVDLSQADSNVLTLELTTDTALTLTDTDIAAFLVYPDGTTAVQSNWVTSGKTVGTGNYGVDPWTAGTALTTGSLGAGDWTGEDATSPNFYKMVLDTSGDAGQATAVSIRIEVYKPSIAAGELFIHPLLTLS